MNKNNVCILSTLTLCLLLSVGFVPTALASGQSIYGTLYIDGEIADPGVTISFKINNDIVTQTTTVTWDQDNFILGFNSIYRGNIGYFYVGDDNLVPDDNASVYIGNWIGKQMDLHVTTPEPDETIIGGGGSGGSGGGMPPPDDDDGYTTSNRAPVADAGGPYFGTTSEQLILDGSGSYDPDGDVLSYTWDFGDGSTGSGIIVSHQYDEGIYTAILTVSDGSLSDSDTAEVTIVVENNPPMDLQLSGDTSGSVDETLQFSAVATDPDGDLIRFVFNWDDGSDDTISSYVISGATFDVTHSWSSYGLYTVTVYAEDTDGAKSPSVTLEVAIDVLSIGNEDILGILIDEDSDGNYDGFINDATGRLTSAKTQDDGTTVFDADGDGEFDHVYDPDTETINELSTADDGMDGTTIGLIIALFLLVLLILVWFLYKRRKATEEQTKS